MTIGFVANANADDNVRVSNITYYENGVNVHLEMTNTARQKYESVSVKVVPSRGIQGIVEGVKYTSVSPNGSVYFECEEGKGNQCKKYDFEVITQDVKVKE